MDSIPCIITPNKFSLFKLCPVGIRLIFFPPVFYFGGGRQSQGLVYARQTLEHRATAPVPFFIKPDILPFNLQFNRATKVSGKLELEVWGTERITELPDMFHT